MPLNPVIETARYDTVQRLRALAKHHHRSLEGELIAIIEAAAREDELATPP